MISWQVRLLWKLNRWFFNPFFILRKTIMSPISSICLLTEFVNRGQLLIFSHTSNTSSFCILIPRSSSSWLFDGKVLKQSIFHHLRILKHISDRWVTVLIKLKNTIPVFSGLEKSVSNICDGCQPLNTYIFTIIFSSMDLKKFPL